MIPDRISRVPQDLAHCSSMLAMLARRAMLFSCVGLKSNALPSSPNIRPNSSPSVALAIPPSFPLPISPPTAPSLSPEIRRRKIPTTVTVLHAELA
jgi:hypothetical protein